MALKMNSFRWIMVFLIVAFAGFWNPVQAGGVQKKLKLCMQSCTFHRFSLQEAFEKTHELGVKYIEIFPGHRIGGKYGDQLFDYRLSDEARRDIRAMAAENGLKIVATGVMVPTDPAEWEQIFAFAKDMGMEYVTCEPVFKDWDLVEKLSDTYKIGVAVHNHPQPSDYWTPDNLLQQIAHRSKRIGSCADVGHWRREGLDQIECLRKLEGRIHMLHFKDIAAGEDSHDVIWGTGILNVEAMLRELQRQGFSGYLSIEYEYNWENSVPEIRESIRYFDKTVAGL